MANEIKFNEVRVQAINLPVESSKSTSVESVALPASKYTSPQYSKETLAFIKEWKAKYGAGAQSLSLLGNLPVSERRVQRGPDSEAVRADIERLKAAHRKAYYEQDQTTVKPKREIALWEYPLAIVGMILGMGCAPTGSNDDSMSSVDTDGDSTGPVNENPDPVPGDSDGVGSVTNLGQGNCNKVVDLMATGASYLAVCADESGEGAATLEQISSGVDSIALPDIFPGIMDNPDVPVRLDSAAKSGDQIYAAFSPSDESLLGLPGAEGASGIYVTNSSGEVTETRQFEYLEAAAPLIGFELYTPGAEGQTVVNGFQSNTAVKTEVIGGQLAALKENRVVDLNTNTLAYAPASFQVGSDEIVLLGSYRPKTFKELPDGDILILVGGIDNVENGSSLVRLTNSGSGYTKADEIFLTDSDGAFMANQAGTDGLAIFEQDGVPYAIVGDSNGSGEVAIVNLDDGSVQFKGVFESGAIASIEIDGEQAIVTAKDGRAESLRLSDFTVSGSPATISGEDVLASAISGNEVVVAQEGGAYKKIALNEPTPAEEEGADSTGG